MDESVIVNGIRIVYQVEGHGEPVIMLHGNGLSHGMWKYNIGPMSQRFRVYAPDLPGFGLSDKPDVPYGVEYYVAFLKAFMDALGIEKASIVGHSFLGVVAATFAMRYPERMDRLVLADACGIVSFDTAGYKLAFMAGVWLTGRSRRLFRLQMFHDRANASRLEGVPLLHDSPESRTAFYRNCSEILDIKMDYLWLIGQIKAPTLVLGGDCDHLVPPKGIRKYGEIIKGARTVLMERCAHVPNIEKPDEFNAEVIRFLNEPCA